MSDGKVTLRSYRLAFNLERRLHRIDRFRIPVPYGVPLVGMAYALVIGIALALAGQLPLLGGPVQLLPWPMRLILLPGLGARVLCQTRADGRPAHEVLAAYVVFRLGPRRLVGLQRSCGVGLARLDDVTIAPDEFLPVYRAGTIVGPARLLLRQPARIEVKGRRIAVKQLADRPMLRARELQLADRQRVVVR
jgi:hypothetical protein